MANTIGYQFKGLSNAAFLRSFLSFSNAAFAPGGGACSAPPMTPIPNKLGPPPAPSPGIGYYAHHCFGPSAPGLLSPVFTCVLLIFLPTIYSALLRRFKQFSHLLVRSTLVTKWLTCFQFSLAEHTLRSLLHAFLFYFCLV